MPPQKRVALNFCRYGLAKVHVWPDVGRLQNSLRDLPERQRGAFGGSPKLLVRKHVVRPGSVILVSADVRATLNPWDFFCTLMGDMRDAARAPQRRLISVENARDRPMGSCQGVS